jgi:hypothetical protein
MLCPLLYPSRFLPFAFLPHAVLPRFDRVSVFVLFSVVRGDVLCHAFTNGNAVRKKPVPTVYRLARYMRQEMRY